MTEHNYQTMLTPAIQALSQGRALLTVEGDPANTMVIGWGTIGYSWGRPVFMVLVRPQRHTYGLIEKADNFTVSMAIQPGLEEPLRFAGTASGRDGDKFRGHGLTAVPAQKVASPIVKECGLHFECRRIHRQEMDAACMASDVLDRCYPKRDLHVLYFGEILSCYTTED